MGVRALSGRRRGPRDRMPPRHDEAPGRLSDTEGLVVGTGQSWSEPDWTMWSSVRTRSLVPTPSADADTIAA